MIAILPQDFEVRHLSVGREGGEGGGAGGSGGRGSGSGSGSGSGGGGGGGPHSVGRMLVGAGSKSAASRHNGKYEEAMEEEAMGDDEYTRTLLPLRLGGGLGAWMVQDQADRALCLLLALAWVAVQMSAASWLLGRLRITVTECIRGWKTTVSGDESSRDSVAPAYSERMLEAEEEEYWNQ